VFFFFSLENFILYANREERREIDCLIEQTKAHITFGLFTFFFSSSLFFSFAWGS